LVKGKTADKGTDSRELKLDSAAKVAQGKRIYKELSVMRQKMKEALTAEARGRADVTIVEMHKKRGPPRVGCPTNAWRIIFSYEYLF